MKKIFSAIAIVIIITVYTGCSAIPSREEIASIAEEIREIASQEIYIPENITSETPEPVINKEAENFLNEMAELTEFMYAQADLPSTVSEQLEQRLRSREFESVEILDVFGTVDGIFIVAPHFEMPAEYIPQERTWYIGAIELNGEIWRSEPWEDALTGEFITTYSRCLFDKKGNIFGVIALDFALDKFNETERDDDR
ncbi:MAG: PDC sensor domain-containing protein [Clostridiales bacterium]|jgi:hypothetical protein|nr:PDC sensor domain-containing protein [Clostridiales bacterium]